MSCSSLAIGSHPPSVPLHYFFDMTLSSGVEGCRPVPFLGWGTLRVVDPSGKQLVEACVAGVAAERARFQEQLLPLIYRFERGGCEHEMASRDFITFLFDDDRLYRRLRTYRGEAPLEKYLWSWILPDLFKQFRASLREHSVQTVPLDGVAFAREAAVPSTPESAAAPAALSALLSPLSSDQRLLLKLMYIEDFDIEPGEIQLLAARTGRSVREVIERIEVARESVRAREAVQHERLEGAASAGQWIRIYQRQIAQLDDDLGHLDAESPQAAQLSAQRAELLHKLEKRRRQQAQCMRDSAHTVVTVPTDTIADLLGQRPSATRSQITRLRQKLAEVWPRPRRAAQEVTAERS